MPHKEGYVMWHDPSQGQWVRVFLHISDSTLSLYHNSSRFGQLIRPSIPTHFLSDVFCSADIPNAPERHIPVLGILVKGKGDRSSSQELRGVEAAGAPPSHFAALASSSSYSRQSSVSSTVAAPSSTANAVPSSKTAVVASETDLLLVFRTVEHRLVLEWCHYLTARDSTFRSHGAPVAPLPKHPVADMLPLRPMISPQLFAQLFRAHDMAASLEKIRARNGGGGGACGASTGAQPSRPHHAAGAPPVPVAVGSSSAAYLRVSSLSALCPRRGGPLGFATPRVARGVAVVNNNAVGSKSPLPSSRTVVPPGEHGGIGRAPLVNRHADPHLSSTTAAVTTTRPGDPPAVVSLAATTSKSEAEPVAVSVSSDEAENATDGEEVAERAGSVDEPMVLLVGASRPPPPPPSSTLKLCDAETNKENCCTKVSLKSSATSSNAESPLGKQPIKGGGAPLSASVAALPASATGDKDAKIREQRALIDDLTSRNVDLEIDQANVSARVLELEGTVDQLRDSVTEWKRRFHSLEQQLRVQETEFEGRLQNERALLTEQLQEEVGRHLQELREKWMAKEAELLTTIATLRDEQAA